MKQFAEVVLEGLVHNIRTPLNLVLGYAQKLPPDNEFAGKIYKAGINIEDMLQNTWDALQMRFCETNGIELNAWLQCEKHLLGCWLKVKHELSVEAIFADVPVPTDISPGKLSEFVEQILAVLLETEGQFKVEISVVAGFGIKLLVSGQTTAVELAKDKLLKMIDNCGIKRVTIEQESLETLSLMVGLV